MSNSVRCEGAAAFLSFLYTAVNVSRKVVKLKSIKAYETIPKGMMGCACSLLCRQLSSRVFTAMEGGAMNTCFTCVERNKMDSKLLTCLLKFIEYFPDYLSALSRMLFCDNLCRNSCFLTVFRMELCNQSFLKNPKFFFQSLNFGPPPPPPLSKKRGGTTQAGDHLIPAGAIFSR